MRQRKTIEIVTIKDTVNRMIAAPKSTAEGREALSVFLSSVLLEIGNYHGFDYIEWLRRGKDGRSGYERWVNDLRPTNTTPYLGDQTRVEYY